jgi:hypothetical protein
MVYSVWLVSHFSSHMFSFPYADIVPKLNTIRPHQQKTPMQNMVEQGLVKDVRSSIDL